MPAPKRPLGSAAAGCSIRPRQRKAAPRRPDTRARRPVDALAYPPTEASSLEDGHPAFDAPGLPMRGSHPGGDRRGTPDGRRTPLVISMWRPVRSRPTRTRGFDAPRDPPTAKPRPGMNGRSPVRSGGGHPLASTWRCQPGRTTADRSGSTPWGKPCHRRADSEGRVCLQGSTPRSGPAPPPAPPWAAKPTRQAGLPGPKRAVSLDSGRGVPIDAGRMAVRPVGCAISISRNPD